VTLSAVDSSAVDVELVRSSLGPLFEGLVKGTLPLTGISFVLGLALALVVALMRLSGNRLLSGAARAFVSLVRGTPLLLQLFIVFYGLPAVGLTIDPYPSAIIAFTLNVGGYASEAVRASILAVPRGQWEAAATLRRVVLPQASRIAVPPLSNTLISLVKDTSLASTVLVTELLRKAQEIAAPSFDFFTLYGVAAVYYWVVCLLLSFGQDGLETRLSRYVAA
jgi:cystine transport system permease protein